MRKILSLIGVLLVVSLLALSLVSCAKPLTLNILAPTDGKEFNKSSLEVRGTLSDAKTTVWVNDAVVTVTKPRRGQPHFSTKLDLNEGENTIKVMAARGKPGKWKDVVERQVTVTYKSS